MLHRNFVRELILVAAGCLWSAGYASAASFYSATAQVIDTSGTVHSAESSFFGATQFIESTSFQGGSAFVQADYTSGLIRESAQSVSTTDTSLSVGSSAGVGITGGLIFAGTGSGNASVNWSMDGTASIWNGLAKFSGGNVALADLVFQAFDYTTGVTTSETVELSNIPFTSCDPTYICVTGSSFNQNGSFLYPVHAGSIISLTVFEFVDAYDNASIDFSHTTQLSLSGPANLTYTSQSGQFLGATAPVPEPQSALLLVTGLGFLAASKAQTKRRGRRGQ